jgi:hypothetical protein
VGVGIEIETVLDADLIHVSHRLPSVTAPSTKDGYRKCMVCGKYVAGPNHQNHMGKHIILSLRGIPESKVVTAVI